MHTQNDGGSSSNDAPFQDTGNAVVSGPGEGNGDSLPSPSRRKLVLLIAGVILVAILASGITGYLVGSDQGRLSRAEAVRAVTDEQFELALQDIDAGRFDVARQRLEYISRLDPTYPQVAEQLAVTLLALNAPTSTPPPEFTPTPNLDPVEDLMGAAESKIAEEDWTGAIQTLLALRAKNPDYRSVDVDGLLFTALRNRGMFRITQGLMEEGLYDLSLASRFGPLDLNAIQLKSLAEEYLLANSYYGLDWAMAAELFAQLCFAGATSDSCYKYGFSSWSYGDLLVSLDDPCGAEEQYHRSLQAWDNPDTYPTATKAARACQTATAPAPPPPPSETDTPEGTPAEEVTQTPTPTDEGTDNGT